MKFRRQLAFITMLLCPFAGTMAQIDPVVLEHLGRLQLDAGFLTFPEPRERPIRLLDELPDGWASRTSLDVRHFAASAQPGEYFAFQIGVLAHKHPLNGLEADWTDFTGNPPLPRAAMTCFNTAGIDYRGRAFTKRISVPAGRIQPLWFGVQIPETAAGIYRSSVTLSADGGKPHVVEVELQITGTVVENNGFDRGRSLSRLAWLNTTIGSDVNVTRGFQPVRRNGRTMSILGRMIGIGEDGFPSEITSFFEPSNQFLLKKGKQLLGGSFRFVIEKEDGSEVRLVSGPLRFVEENPSAVRWRVTHSGGGCEFDCEGRLEFDGFMEYALALKSNTSLAVRDIRLEVPLKKESTPYMMGLHHEGGLRPSHWDWHWDTTRNQDMLWIGDVNGGLRMKWKAENYVRPLINLYYGYGRLQMPHSWGNGGKGGVLVEDAGAVTMVKSYCGPRRLGPEEILHFDLEMLVTPFRTIDTTTRWADRYYHGGGTNAMSKIAKAESVGANIINIHHAEDIYPFINYPYLDENVPALRRLVDSAHHAQKRLKLYYTTRELTKNLPEFWAFRSLNGEIIFPGPASACTTIINPKGPDEWLRRNVKDDYIPAWLNLIAEGPFKGELDLAVITTPDSRLNNFYIGGLDWMLKHIGIDGVYIDDSALDRETVRRARKLIDHYRPQGRIDFHSWNHFNAMAGFTNCLNLYMDLLPYFDLVWIGEQRDYDRLPDHWLIEVSGIPFGLTGQMLNNAGNPWRGMLYGITNRPGWAGDPSELWKFWDRTAIHTKTMVGYWDRQNPVKTDHDLVKATVYKGRKQSIIAVAGWGQEDISCALQPDWKALGLNRKRCRVTMPAIPGFQDERKDVALDRLTIPAGKGFLIVLDEAR
ncbi:MAG TPA: glycoside hydrolase domain-containing protein [Bacteroidota bacterium]|nr:glycoside hydrolase domain-containing protein [Bacteroidota bacterium]